VAQPEEKLSLDQVFQLVDKLSPPDQEKLRKRLSERSWGDRWDKLVQKVQEQSKGLPEITEEEVADEVMAYRREQKARRAQSGR
jgi:hypothetical protein